jgi:hypothetical protein
MLIRVAGAHTGCDEAKLRGTGHCRRGKKAAGRPVFAARRGGFCCPTASITSRRKAAQTGELRPTLRLILAAGLTAPQSVQGQSPRRGRSWVIVAIVLIASARRLSPGSVKTEPRPEIDIGSPIAVTRTHVPVKHSEEEVLLASPISQLLGNSKDFCFERLTYTSVHVKVLE